jgi:alpha/beta superfamily hydrolase
MGVYVPTQHPLQTLTLPPPCTAQDAERAELERISQQLAEERQDAEAALTSANAMREQQAAAAADVARREAVVEAKQGQLAGLQAQLVAAQGAALQQLEVLEGAVRTRLEGHQKQVRRAAAAQLMQGSCDGI